MEEKSKKPKIRFKGFTEAWEQRKLGDIVYLRGRIGFRGYKRTDLVSEGDGAITFSPADIDDDGHLKLENNTYISFDKYEESPEIKVHEGDILFTKTASIGKIAYVPKLREKSTINPQFALLTPNNNIDNYFLFLSLRTEDCLTYAKNITGGSTIPTMSQEKLKEMDIILPDKEEQKKLGQYFKSIDNLITLHQRKYDKLVNVKKSLLEKMFPKNDSDVPEIRFKGFTEAWEQRKLGEYGDFTYGHSAPKWSVTSDATTPCVRYGELYTKFGVKIDKVFSHTNMPHNKLVFSKGTEVLIPRVGEDPYDYNHCTWLSIPNVAIGEMISIYYTKQNPLFTAIMYNATLRNEFAIRVEGGSVTNLYYEKLKDIDVAFPKKEEQEKISQFFYKIDNLITLHQRKLEKLKNIKKSLLEKMFI